MYSVGNMKIGVRLGLGFALMALFMLGIGVAGWMGVSKQSVTAQHVVDQDVPYLSALATTRHNLMLLRRFEKDALINIASADKVKDYRKKWMDAREQLNASLKLAGKYAPNAEAVKRAEGISAALARYDSVFAQVMTAILAGELKSTSEGNQKIDAAKGDLHALETLITELFQDVNKQVDTLKPMLVEMEHNVSLLLVAALVAAIVAAITLAILITRSITRPLAQAVEVADAMAIGDLSKRIEIRSEDETGQLLRSMQKMVDAIRALVADAAMLSKAAVDGKLETRADATKHQGDFHRVVTGVNETLDAVIGPLNVSASYVEQISRGAIPARITDSYNGDFNTIKNNLNTCIDAVDALVADADLLSRAAVEGKLETRADATKHQGDFRKIVEGVNATLDAMIGPMNEGMRVFGALSKGDLTERITDNYQGTFQKLKEDANLTVDKLTEIVGQIKESTESINVASKEIASGNADLSQRTEEQASSLEETASSMEELTSTVKQNAENAKQANQLAIGASDVAMKGGDVVGQVVTTMSSINESSKKIVDIIGVIDGIAFQTNILALNAAVEAARAGEQGRGFAVVATEVRNLAQRSAAAAKEIKTLIDDSVDKVGAGTKLVDEAGKTMEEIVTSIRRVTDIMAEITAASQEQSSGIEQVNTAITQMDEVTQQNAALVEEAAAAAESLEEQAGNLAQAVAMFKLGSASGGTATCATGRREAATRPANVARLPMKTAPGRHGAKKTAAEMPRPGTARDLAKVAGGADEQWEEF